MLAGFFVYIGGTKLKEIMETIFNEFTTLSPFIIFTVEQNGHDEPEFVALELKRDTIEKILKVRNTLLDTIKLLSENKNVRLTIGDDFGLSGNFFTGNDLEENFIFKYNTYSDQDKYFIDQSTFEELKSNKGEQWFNEVELHFFEGAVYPLFFDRNGNRVEPLESISYNDLEKILEQL